MQIKIEKKKEFRDIFIRKFRASCRQPDREWKYPYEVKDGQLKDPLKECIEDMMTLL